VGAGRGGTGGAARGEGWERGLAVDGRGERVRGGVRRRWGVGAQVYRPPQARTQCERNPWPVKRPPHTGGTP